MRLPQPRKRPECLGCALCIDGTGKKCLAPQQNRRCIALPMRHGGVEVVRVTAAEMEVEVEMVAMGDGWG